MPRGLSFLPFLALLVLSAAFLSSSAQAASQATDPVQVVPAPPPPPPPPPPPYSSRESVVQMDPTVKPVPSPFHITGTVINAATNAPLARCTLTVSPMTSGRSIAQREGRGPNSRAVDQTRTAVTDVAGRFDIELPSAGGWSLRATSHGYRAQAFQEHEGYSTGIVLTDATPAIDLTFRLTPASSIEGFVLDEAGEPVRNGQLSLLYIPPASPDTTQPKPQNRGQQRTDDRGYYKFSGLLSGEYEFSVRAQPWYATAARGMGSFGGALQEDETEPLNSAPDPLDVVYPITWYPGVTDPSAATPILLGEGETRSADFRLLPVPGYHLRVAGTPPPKGEDGTPEIRNSTGEYYITQILPDGSETGVPTPMHMDAQGNLDIAGLAPGTYLVHVQGDGSGPIPAPTTLRITSSSARSVDLSQGVAATPVSVKTDPETQNDSLQIYFRAKDGNRVVYAQRPQEFRGGFIRRGEPAVDPPTPQQKEKVQPDRTATLEPGSYDVFLGGGNDLHLARIDATGAAVTGRTVTISGSPAALVLHLTSGRGRVSGTAVMKGQALMGALVLLVPATLGDPFGLNSVRRDQSNTDGSFEITGILPGQYILVAIDHGWELNWGDPGTLRRFLIKGVPLDVRPSIDLKETIEAQSP